MKNNKSGLAKILTNKNTVTVVGIVAAILILYIGYTIRVNSAISPTSVPYALETIPAGTQITQDMIGTMDVPPAMIVDGTIRNQADVIDHYSNADTVIPKGSLFYERSVVEKSTLPGSVILDYPKGYVLFYLPIDVESSYGNSIYPGNYIDIWIKINHKVEEGQVTSNDDEKIIQFGKLYENVKVIRVLDGSGHDVFADLDNVGTPTQLIFALPEEEFVLLTKARYLQNYSTNIIPVPTAASLETNPGEIKNSSEAITQWINQLTYNEQ